MDALPVNGYVTLYFRLWFLRLTLTLGAGSEPE